MKRNPDFKRKYKERKLRKTFLIIVEGETEKNYFNKFHNHKIVKKGKNPGILKLVKEAKEINKNYEYYEVWVVSDIDNCSQKIFDESYKLARKNNIQIAHSNPNFEYWILLHFQSEINIPKNQYSKLITKHLGGKKYKKGTGMNDELFNKLLDKQKTAIENAKKIKVDNNIHTQCTSVYKLVESLNASKTDKNSKAKHIQMKLK